MPRSAVARPCRTIEWGLLAVLASALAVVAPAEAQEPTGGSSPTLPAPEPTTQPTSSSGTGQPDRAAELGPPPTANLYGKPAPRIKRFTCRSSCGAAGAARPGSLIRIGGRIRGPIDEVAFLGAAGDADDTSAAPRRVRRSAVVARVPHTATAGALVLVRPDGTRSPASAQPLTIEPLPVDVPAGAVDADVQGSKVFFGARRQAELSYVVGGSRPADVHVDLLRASDGAVVEQWDPGEIEPGVAQTLAWDGTAGGRVQRDGVYQFRVTATDSAGVSTSSSSAGMLGAGTSHAANAQRSAMRRAVDPTEPGTFKFLRYRFPLVGAHHYGEFGASFGGGRNHQGHDVFAACGTPIVAARGGVVQFKRFQSAAGNYVVIDGARTGVDFAYMHLREAALVEEGERVRTGQPIGFVGQTGRASDCHLHFEEWSAPGWYSGGSAFDPLPDLRAWDAQS
jgi:murein DD-endopeptidase MepM/ murein hydrolase activator NlpD